MNQPVAVRVVRPREAFLDVQGISRRFGEVAALDSVSLAARRGEIVCLAGQSGCGKSSLLRIIAGVDRPDAGTIVLDGEEIEGAVHAAPEVRRIGLIFQDYALFPHLDVTGNILFGLKHFARVEAERRCQEAIERLGLQHLAQRYPHMLSGGEHQRVALARALAPSPRVLLMDEPFSNLDRKLRDSIRNETLALLRKLGTTVIMVTHDPEEALSAGDSVILMRAGRIVQSGTSSDLYDHPNSAYAAEFFCDFNKIPGICRGGFIETPLGRAAALGHPDGEAVLYVRPQALQIGGEEGVVAKVMERRLRGEIEEVTFTLAGLPQPLRRRSTERSGLVPGQQVKIQADPAGTFVF
jgi:iron(III) transport system ATP-binding protein